MARLAFGGLVLLALAPRAIAAGVAADLQAITCPRQAGEYVATLDDRIVLSRGFLDEKLSEDENVRAAILQQEKYVWGWLRTNAEAHRAMRVVLSAEAPEITVTSKTVGRYGRDLVLDWKETDPRLAITDRYTARAIERGAIAAGDEALIVDYRIRFKLAVCGDARPASSEVRVMLPADPWLMYWHVPAKERRPMRYFDDRAITTPCSDDDFADLPLPFYYWYDWQPDRHGPDDAGRPFDCRALLVPERDYFARTLKMERLASPSSDFSEVRRGLEGDGPLGVTVIIGALDHSYTDLGPATLADALGAGRPLGERVAAALDGERERGTRFFLSMLRDLGLVMEVGAHEAAVAGDALRVTVSGRLRRSGRAVRVRAFLSLTDVFGPRPPGHWAIERDALGHDQVIVYAGHSGIGENFRLARIAEQVGATPGAIGDELGRVPFQLVAFLSCYSYMYFGQDLIAAAAQRLVGREYVFTGSEYTRGDRGPLVILDLVDQVLAGAPPSLRWVKPDDFLLLKSFTRR